MTLATIYAPNVHQVAFLCKTLSKLVEFAEGKLILGEECNVSLDPEVDASSVASSVPLGSRKRILQTLHDLQLVDAWHGTGLHFLFFPPPIVFSY